MFIFCMELHLSLPCDSLKGKRGIVKSLLGRARNHFNVSCAEVDRQDNPRVAVLGFVTVSPDKVIARTTLERLEEVGLRELAGRGDHRSGHLRDLSR